MGEHEPVLFRAHVVIREQGASIARRFVINRGDPDLFGEIALGRGERFEEAFEQPVVALEEDYK